MKCCNLVANDCDSFWCCCCDTCTPSMMKFSGLVVIFIVGIFLVAFGMGALMSGVTNGSLLFESLDANGNIIAGGVMIGTGVVMVIVMILLSYFVRLGLENSDSEASPTEEAI